MNSSANNIQKLPEESKVEIYAQYGCEYSESYHVMVLQRNGVIKIRVQLGEEVNSFKISSDEFVDLWRLLISKNKSPDVNLFEPETASTADHGGNIRIDYRNGSEDKSFEYNVGVLEDIVTYFDSLIKKHDS